MVFLVLCYLLLCNPVYVVLRLLGWCICQRRWRVVQVHTITKKGFVGGLIKMPLAKPQFCGIFFYSWAEQNEWTRTTHLTWGYFGLNLSWTQNRRKARGVGYSGLQLEPGPTRAQFLFRLLSLADLQPDPTCPSCTPTMVYGIFDRSVSKYSSGG